jgi:hypothetical protein
MSNIERILTFDVRNITRLDDLYDALDLLAREIQRIINAYRLDAAQLHDLAKDLARMRYLISALPVEKARSPQSGNNMVARYLELEGKVKELRNETSMRS